MGFYYELFPCFKSLIKELLGFNRWKKDYDTITDAILTIVTVFLLIILLVLLSPWILFNYMIRGYLALVHGSNYGGLLDMDSPFENLDPTILLNTVYIIEHSGSNEELYKDIKKACKKLFESHCRFSSTVRKCVGFYYFLNNQIAFDDIVSSVDYKEDKITKDALLSYLEDNYLSVPTTEYKVWDVKIFNKPIVWGEQTKTYYPVLIRTNHSVADGICLSVFHQKHLISDVVNTQFEHAVRRANKSTDFFGNVNVHNIIDIGKSLDYKNLDSENEKLSQKIAVFAEDEPKYFRIIKQLRAHLKVTFTDVIATAAISSLTDYLNENGLAPETILFGNTTRAVTENSAAILSGNILRNEATLHIAEIPCRTSVSKSLTSQLKTVSKVLGNTRNSADSQCIYLLQKFCAFLPAGVLGSLIVRCTHGVSLGITNIPAPNYGRIENHPINDVLIFPSRFGNTKFVMTIFSYGGRLQVILLSKNGLVTTREDLERILYRTFKNIDTMWEENKEAIENRHSKY